MTYTARDCQYSRQGCLQLRGLPKSFRHSELEDTALKLFRKLNFEIESFKTEDYHWLPSKGPESVTVKCSKQKGANSIRTV